MASITEQKLEQRRWIHDWFKRRASTRSRADLEADYLAAIRNLSARMTLAELQEWRTLVEGLDDG